MKRNRIRKAGYGTLMALVMLALASLTVAGMLEQSISNSKTIYQTKLRSVRHFQAEQALARAASWLRNNSQALVTPYKRENFYTLFDRSTLSAGANDSSLFAVGTLLKLEGTNNSAILANDASLASAAFAATKDVTTNSVFSAVSEFSNDLASEILVRITLIDAVPENSSNDYGDTSLGNPQPETDFIPVYRIDAMSAIDQGAHVYASVVGDVTHSFELGFYGQNQIEMRQSCDSYMSGSGAYNPASNRNANCPTSSNSTAQVHGNEDIFGSLRTNGAINTGSPFGGDICADFGCSDQGEICEGQDCSVPLLPTYDSWATLCPSNQGDILITSDQTLSVLGSAPNQRCWNKVTVKNATLTLDTTDEAYYFKTLYLQGGQAAIKIAPPASLGTVSLYLETVTGDSINGGQAINANSDPTDFLMIYLGTSDLKLNGNAAMYAALISPNAGVQVQGSFEYYGAILAKSLTATGSGDIHYDESLGIGSEPLDMRFTLRDIVQRYR